MNDKEMCRGFSPEKQANYEAYLVNRYGDKAKMHIADAKTNVANWSKTKNEKAFADWDAICEDLAEAMAQNRRVETKEVQAIIMRHYDWIQQFWKPDHDSYIGLGLGYTAYEWKQAFEKVDNQHPKLAEFMGNAMEVFAERELK